MKKFNAIIRNLKKYKNSNFFKAKFLFTNFYEKEKINEKEILFESFLGNNFNGNPFYIFKEICENSKYDEYKKYIVASSEKNKKSIIKMLDNYGLLGKADIVLRNTKQYCYLLATAKYLINNVTFPTYFIRKEEQIYLNTWHGTPLKGLGRNIKDKPNSIGNVQRNFIHATHLLFPNDFTFDIIREDYMLNNIYTGKYIKSGYPRNDIFFNEERRKFVKEKLGLKNKKIVVYMPTWREKTNPKQKNDKQLTYIMYALYEFEKKLPDDTVVLVKLHHLANKAIDFKEFDKIIPFPEEYETYDVLNIADKLVTDYSSVMFDFLNTGKDVILYTYDEKEYCNGRSLYMEIKDLPFYYSDDINLVCEKIKEESQTEKNEKIRNELCFYDSKDSVSKLCEYIFEKNLSNDKFEVIDHTKYNNGKKNILIFAGGLQKNGITSALRAILNNIDLDENNYFLTFYNNATKQNIDFINNLDKRVCYMPIMGQKNFKKYEAIFYHLYFRWNINVINKIKKIYDREKFRLYRNINFDTVIHYTGYERQIIHLLSSFKNSKKIIYTHNDLKKERKLRKNIHLNSLKYAYNTFDKIAIIRNGMEKEIKSNVKDVDIKKIFLAHNINDIKYIRNKANEKIEFSSNTVSNVEKETLENILNTNAIKFINIARFSPEKGLDILVEAFLKFNKEFPNSYLILIGGHGKDYDKIKKMSEVNEKIIIIKNLYNPYSILNKSDCFVLSSHYEGLPMAIMEAMILKKKIICTNIPGPREFLNEKNYAYLVETNIDSIYKGMIKFKEDGLKECNVFDAEEFNEMAIEEFYNLINK